MDVKMTMIEERSFDVSTFLCCDMQLFLTM